jgi:hypothetical protein
VVCGHSECGAMKAVIASSTHQEAPNLAKWLHHAHGAAFRLEHEGALDAKLKPHDQLSQLNVLVQLEHLMSYPIVRERVAAGTLRLSAWWFESPSPKPRMSSYGASGSDLQLAEGVEPVEAELVEHAEEMPMTDNPATAHPQPPQHEQQQSPPGKTRVMTPTPDHGEESYRGSGKLAGKAALITGADSGIGRAVAIAFAREGADVVISYLEERDDARETARWVEQAGRRAILIDGDVSKDDHCRMLVKRTVGELGKIDILVNNAAMQRTHESIEEISSEEWDQTFRTNIYSMFYLCKESIPRMSAGSAIVNTASINSKRRPRALLPTSRQAWRRWSRSRVSA